VGSPVGGSGTLDLGTTDLAALQDGFSEITIGRSDAGAVVIGTALVRDDVTIEGGAMSVGSLSSTGNRVTLISSDAIRDADDDGLTDVTAGSLRLSAGGGIAGTGADDTFESDVDTLAVAAAGDVNLANSGDVVLGSVDGVDGVAATSGSVDVAAASTLTVSEAVSSGGAGSSVTLTADELEVNAGITAAGTGSEATLRADEIAIDTGTGSVVANDRVTLAQKTATREIDLGTETAGQLSLTDAELDRVTAAAVQVGGADAGSIAVTAGVSPGGTSTLHLISGGAISGGGTITESSLAMTAQDGIDVATAGGAVAASNGTSGGVKIRPADDLVVGSVDGVSGITSSNGFIDIAIPGGKLTANEGLTTTGLGGDVKLASREVELNALVTASEDIAIDAPLLVDVNRPMDAAGGIRIDTPGKIRFGSDASTITAGSNLELNANIDQADILDPKLATTAKAEGDLTLTATAGDFAMGRAADQDKRGQKLTAVGDLAINAGGTAEVGDLNAKTIEVDAGAIVLLRRPAGASLGYNQAGQFVEIPDAGVDFVADSIVLSTPATAAAGPDAVTFSTQFGNPVPNAPAGSFFATNKPGQQALATGDFFGPNDEVLDLVAGQVNPPPNADTVPPLPEEVTLRTSLLSQVNQVAARTRPIWESEAVRAIECVIFEGEAREEIPEECLDFVAVEEGEEVDPRLQLESVQDARQIYKRLFDEEDLIVDALQGAANAYRDAVSAGSVTGKGFRAFLEREEGYAAALDYLNQFAVLFRVYDELDRDVESGSGELEAQREDLVALFAPVGLSPAEFSDAIESGPGSGQGEAAGKLLASDGLPRSLRGTP
jgi:hypothetical protein